jgi:hypothetical protein
MAAVAPTQLRPATPWGLGRGRDNEPGYRRCPIRPRRRSPPSEHRVMQLTRRAAPAAAEHRAARAGTRPGRNRR